MSQQGTPVSLSVYPPFIIAMLSSLIPSSASLSSSSSTGKRKRSEDDSAVIFSASLSSHFPKRTKQRIVKLNDGENCWYCGGAASDICHIISRKDSSIYAVANHIFHLAHFSIFHPFTFTS